MPPAEALRPGTPHAPAKRVASATACAAWILATGALLPLVGWMFGAALFVLAILLLARHRPLPHDRRVGWAGLAIALVSLGLTSVSVVRWAPEISASIAGKAARRTAVSVPSTTPAAQPSEEETPEATDAARTPPSDETGLSRPSPPVYHADPAPYTKPGWRYWTIVLVVLILSIIFHEIGHAVAAWWSGDTTARDLGRVSLKPARHIDLVGSIIVPCVLLFLNATVIAWARPVPVRPDRYRHSRRGQLAVNLAGVSLNLILALLATRLLMLTMLLIKYWYPHAPQPDVAFSFHSWVPPQVPHAAAWTLIMDALKAGVLLNVTLLWLNLLPIPPLDGFGVVRAIAPRALGNVLGRLSGLATVGLLLLIAFKLLDTLLLPAIFLAAFLILTAHAGVYGLHGI